MKYFPKFLSYGLVISLFSTTACMGIGLPFTDYRLMNWPVEISRKATNSTCTDFATLTAVASELEGRHLAFLRSKDDKDALTSEFFLSSLGEQCQARFTSLSIPQIKTELFGDLQTITDSSKLRELGGLAFAYGNTTTKGGIEITLHLDRASKGPDRRMVAIYRLEDGKILHYNYSGTDNVDEKSRSWPLDQFFGIAIGAAGKALIP